MCVYIHIHAVPRSFVLAAGDTNIIDSICSFLQGMRLDDLICNPEYQDISYAFVWIITIRILMK